MLTKCKLLEEPKTVSNALNKGRAHAGQGCLRLLVLLDEKPLYNLTKAPLPKSTDVNCKPLAHK